MKTKRWISFILILSAAAVLLSGCGQKTVDQSAAQELTLSGYGSAGASADNDLTLEKMMNYAIQDEYAARAEYELILDAYGEQQLFQNIMSAEETHIATLTALFQSYGFAIPKDTSADYVVLPASLDEAYQTGVDAEILNIAMYKEFLSYDLPSDVAQVFTSLMEASQNHLASFKKHL